MQKIKDFDMESSWVSLATAPISHPSPYPTKYDIHLSPLRLGGKAINLNETAFYKAKESSVKGVKIVKFNCEFGSVATYIEQLRANCGISFLSGPSWHVHYGSESEFKKNKELLEDKFQEFLMLHSDRNKLLVSDTVGGRRWYNFCKRHGWKEGEHTYNGNSGNMVVTFETDRKQLIGKDLEITYLQTR